MSWCGGQLFSFLHRGHHLQCVSEQRDNVNRNQYCEQFSAVGKRVWHSTALVSPTKTLNTDLAPVGDEIGPIEVPHKDVELRDDEDEEPLEAEGPSPTSREKQEHADSGHATCRSWCAACVEGTGVVGRRRIELLNEEEGQHMTPIVAFDDGFMAQENADTFPSLICFGAGP